MGSQGISISLGKKLALATLACVQNSLVGGLIYGWASMQPLLTSSTEETGAGLTPTESTTIFSWATCIGMAATLLLGYVLDRFGPRLCSCVSHISIGVGCMVFSVATTFETFAIGSCLMSFGGPGIQVSIVHLANLFPENKFLSLSLLNGTICVSFAVFTTIEWFWEMYPELSFRPLFAYFAGLVGLSLVGSAFCWPDVAYEAHTDNSPHYEMTVEEEYIEAKTAHQHLLEQPLGSYLREDRSHSIERQESYIVSKKALASGMEEMISLKDLPFRQQLYSAVYLRSLVFFIATCFLANFYVASITTEVSLVVLLTLGCSTFTPHECSPDVPSSKLADFQDFSLPEQRQLARIFTLFMSAGVFASVLVGSIMDHAGLELATSLTLLLGILHIVVLSLLGDRFMWMIFGFFLYVMFRQFLFPLFIASLMHHLGYKFFGLLSGTGFFLSGISQIFMASLANAIQGDCHDLIYLKQYGTGEDCDGGMWAQLHMREIAVLVLLFLVPMLDRRERREHEEEVEKVIRARSSWHNLSLYGAEDGTESSSVFGQGYGSTNRKS